MSVLIKPNPTTATVVIAPVDAYRRKRADIRLDGVHDEDKVNDAVALRRRIVLLDGAVHLGGPILLPSSGEQFSLVGQGMGVTTLYLDDGADSNMMYMNPTGECKWFEFGHFSMDGNGSNQSDGAGRDQRSAFFINDHGDWLRMFSLSNIFVRNTRHGAGMRLFGLVFSELNFVVCNNNGIGGAAFPSDGLYMKNSERVLLSNIVSHDNSDTGVALDYSGHMQLVNIHAHGNTYQGMTMADRSHRFLVSNSIFQSSQYGLKSGPFLGSGRTHMLSISCCHFMNNTVFGLELQDHDHLTMVSSVFEGNIGDLNQINTGGTIRGRGNIPMLDFG